MTITIAPFWTGVIVGIVATICVLAVIAAATAPKK